MASSCSPPPHPLFVLNGLTGSLADSSYVIGWWKSTAVALVAMRNARGAVSAPRASRVQVRLRLQKTAPVFADLSSALAWRAVQRVGGRFHEPMKCNHQDLLSSLSVLPVPPGGKQRACLHRNPGVLDASRDFLARNSYRDNAISAEPACSAGGGLWRASTPAGLTHSWPLALSCTGVRQIACVCVCV